MINLKINDIPVTVPEGTSVLQAAKMANIEIPSLCYLKDINCIGACRVCVVEIKGRRGLTAACTYPVEEGLEVLTNTATVRKSRKTTIELLLSTHRKKCLSCIRSGRCESAPVRHGGMMPCDNCAMKPVCRHIERGGESDE